MATEILTFINGYITCLIGYVILNIFIQLEMAGKGHLPRTRDAVFFYLGLPFAPIILLLYPLLIFVGSKLIEDETNKAFLPTQDETQKLYKKILDNLKKKNK